MLIVTALHLTIVHVVFNKFKLLSWNEGRS